MNMFAVRLRTVPLLVLSTLGLFASLQVMAQADRDRPPQQQAPAQPPPKPPREAAPIDLTGYWVAVVTEDWRYRMVVPAKGDYASVPLTPEARKVAANWDPEQDKASGNACKAYGVGGIMRMPTRLNIAWVGDNALRIETDAGKQTRQLNFKAESPPAIATRTLQGNSQAQWERSDLKVITKQMLPGYLRRNGVPYSENAVVTEYFYRYTAFDEEWLTVSTVVEDPQYLNVPFLTSSSFKKLKGNSGWTRSDCVSEWGPLKDEKANVFR